MSTWSSNQMVCATCRYWMGQRDINLTATFYDVREPEGKCCKPFGGFRGCKMNEGAYCSEWECFKKD